MNAKTVNEWSANNKWLRYMYVPNCSLFLGAATKNKRKIKGEEFVTSPTFFSKSPLFSCLPPSPFAQPNRQRAWNRLTTMIEGPNK